MKVVRLSQVSECLQEFRIARIGRNE